MTVKPLAGRHILVVEDEMMILLDIEDMLADLGCTSVTSAATVDQALALLAERRFDAATLDINLSGQRSHPVAEALEAQGVPFAFSTGYHFRETADAFRDRPVLRKPFQAQELTRVMTLLLPAP